MIELIRKKAAEIEERLWGFCFAEFGIERTEENAARISSRIEQMALLRFGEVENLEPPSLEQGCELSDFVVIAHLSIAMLNHVTDAEIAANAERAANLLIVAAQAEMAARFDRQIDCLMKEVANAENSANYAGKMLAAKRHKKTQEQAQMIAKIWAEKFPRGVSASAVAEQLIRDGLTPFGHKKTAAIISEAKKKKP